jgi:hypothetical protein
MKRSGSWTWRLATGLLLAGITVASAQHYPAGSEGIKAGSLPGPGLYFRDDNSFYLYEKVPGFGGQEQKGFTQFNYTQTPRLLWISGWNLLGADLGAAIRIPLAYKQFTHYVPVGPPLQNPPGLFPTYASTKTTDRHVGLADIQVEPIIVSWRLQHFDLNASYSFWAPTGDFPGGVDNRNTGYLFYTLGQGYWTHSFSLGVTWYPDEEKSWAISLLNHYDINTAQYSGLYYAATPSGVGSLDTTLGDIDTLEWAISKTILKSLDVGLTGYYQQQVTGTEGPTPNGPTWEGERIHVAGIGPEIDATVPSWGLTVALRYAYEFSALDHPQGHLINLTLTKSF